MDEYDHAQRLLMRIRDEFCDGVSAKLAKKIRKDETYVNRLFYPIGKKGRKGIGLEIMQTCTKTFGLQPGYWEGEDLVRVRPDDQPVSREAWRIALQFDSLSEDGKRRVRSLWNALIGALQDGPHSESDTPDERKTLGHARIDENAQAPRLTSRARSKKE